MLSSFVRRGFAALALVAFAGCASSSLAPSTPGAVPQTASVGRGVPHGSPCNAPWYFHGTCIVYSPTKAGPVTLKAYKGLTTTIKFPFDNAASATFLIGEATGAGDITGTFQGKAFPKYGTIPCIARTGQSTPCPASKAFLYVQIVNAGGSTTLFKSTPAFVVGYTGAAPGKKCGADALEVTPTEAWVLLPIQGTPSGGKVTFPAYATPIQMAPGSYFIFGFRCS